MLFHYVINQIVPEDTCTTTSSSSPETFLHNDSSQFTSVDTLPVNAHVKGDNAQTMCLSSPPPLPPRISRSIQRNAHSEQFSNPIAAFQESSHSVSNSTFSNIRGTFINMINDLLLHCSCLWDFANAKFSLRLGF